MARRKRRPIVVIVSFALFVYCKRDAPPSEGSPPIDKVALHEIDSTQIEATSERSEITASSNASVNEYSGSKEASPELNDETMLSLTSEDQTTETVAFSEDAGEEFDQTHPQPRNFSWKWIDCKDSNMPTSPAANNVSKSKQFITPWYDPINVYIVSNAPGVVGLKSEEIYFIDRRPDTNNRYSTIKHSSLNELKCGIWGNWYYADQAIVRIGNSTESLEMSITKVHSNFYTIKAISKLTGKPIELWLWKRV